MEEKEKEFTLSLTREQAFDLSLWIEIGLFDTIRNDSECDNIQWIHRWIHEIERLEAFRKEFFDDTVESREV